MNDKLGPHHVVDLAPGRRAWLNTLDISWPAHSIYGLLEVDVTLVRRFIAAHKARTGETLSLVRSWARCTQTSSPSPSLQLLQPASEWLL